MRTCLIGGRHVIVSGFARFEIAQQSGFPTVPAHVLSEQVHPWDLLLQSVCENMCGRGLNLIEKAIAAEKSQALAGRDETIATVLPALAMKPSPLLLVRLQEIRSLSTLVQHGMAVGAISEGLVDFFLRLSDEDQALAAQVITCLHLTAGNSRDFLRESIEIVGRDRMTYAQLMGELGVALGEPIEPSRVGAERARFLHDLHLRRHPMLARLRNQHETNMKKLGWGSNVRLRPPRDFEGDHFSLEITAHSATELRDSLSRISLSIDRDAEALRQIFEPSAEE